MILLLQKHEAKSSARLPRSPRLTMIGPAHEKEPREAMTMALDDVTVLDLSHALAGPFASTMLGDFGARVIKVEPPGTGDISRAWGPPFYGSEPAYFVNLHRNNHPQVEARGMLVEQEHPVAGTVRMVGVPVRLSETPGAIRTPAPLLGQHTDEVLRDCLGLDDEEIERLRQAGAIGRRR